MEIIHYISGLPPVRLGGLVRYALDLASGQQKLGNNVSIVIPGKYQENVTKIKEDVWNSLPCYIIENSLPVTAGSSVKEIEKLYVSGDEELYITFLKNIMPDIIHVHTFMGLHIAFLIAAKRLSIPIVYTTHDYYGLCLNATLFRNDGCICDGNWLNCDTCMGGGIAVKKLVKKQSNKYKKAKSYSVYHWMEYSPALLPLKKFLRQFTSRLREFYDLRNNRIYDENKSFTDRMQEYENLKVYYRNMFDLVTYFHFNSEQSKDIYIEQLGKREGEVVYLSKKNIVDRRKIYEYKGKLKLGFIAYDKPFKGFSVLKEALDEMYDEGMTDIECHIFANYWDKASPYIKMHMPYENDDIKEAYSNFDILVQPSLCKETFGFTTLEAVSFGKPVIVSPNVAAKEILNGLCLVVDAEKKSLKKELIKIYNDRSILENLNRKINFAKIEFDYLGHCQEILKLYERLKRNYYECRYNSANL